MSRKYCDCHGATHPLIDDNGAAMMCQNCGNIYCEQQGRGPCLFCGFRTLSDEIAKPDSRLEYWRSSGRKPPSDPSYSAGKRDNEGVDQLEQQKEADLDMATRQFREMVHKNLQDAFAGAGLVDDQMVAFDDLGE